MNQLDSIKKQFAYYQHLGHFTFNQLDDSQLFWQFNEESNSIAVIVQHLWGNMMSRWSDFLISDGEKEWRNRDSEFESSLTNKEDVLEKWEEGWNCLFHALDNLEDKDFERIIFIRNQGHTVSEALHRQMSHYAYHVGQIVYIGRMLKGNAWKSLSIPRGASVAFNKEKFNQPKSKKHFTEEFLSGKTDEGIGEK